MKTKNLFVAAALSVALVSCSTDEVVSTDIFSDSNAISFSAYSNVSTDAGRATEIADLTAFNKAGNTTGFHANAYYTSGEDYTSFFASSATTELIKYSESTGTDGSWSFSSANVYYWPTMALDFYGYYNGTATASEPTFASATGMSFADYTIPETLTGNALLDFMVAATKGATNSTSNTVTLDFKHALTQVQFNAYTNSADAITVVVQSISIENIASSGDLAVTDSTGTTLAWTDNTSTAGSMNFGTLTSPVTLGTDSTNPTDISTASAMLIPQAFTAWSTTGDYAATNASNTGAYLAISCSIKQTINGTYVLGGTDSYGTIYVPFSSQYSSSEIWKAGNKITYTLTFGGGYTDGGDPILNPILISASVTTAWNEVAASQAL